MEYHVSGDDTEKIIKATLMDAKSILVQFENTTNSTERLIWFNRVRQIYVEMGGGNITITQNQNDTNTYLIRPVDDPKNNY